MDSNVKKVLEEQIWYVATFGDEPNVVPIGFKKVMDDGRLAICDVFMDVTLKNVLKNGKMAISVCNKDTAESYQVKGSAEYVTSGEQFDEFAKMAEAMFKGAAPAKGTIIVTPEKIIVSSPGANNNKFI